MMVGRSVLARLLQADEELKTRPALVLRELRPFGDLLLCGVSSQLRHAVVGLDDIIYPADTDFTASGLRVASLIRVGYLGVIPPLRVVGEIGTISDERCRRVLQQLSDYLKPQ